MHKIIETINVRYEKHLLFKNYIVGNLDIFILRKEPLLNSIRI